MSSVFLSDIMMVKNIMISLAVKQSLRKHNDKEKLKHKHKEIIIRPVQMEGQKFAEVLDKYTHLQP